MSMSDYLTLLTQLKVDSQTIFGFLLTVGLGVIAFIGSAQKVSPITYVLLAVLFLGFAGSNYHALDKNFETRIEVGRLAKDCDADNRHRKLILMITPSEEFWLYKGITSSQGNLAFQVAISFFVFMVIVVSGVIEYRKQSAGSKPGR